MSDTNTNHREWHEHVEEQLVDAEWKIKEALSVCEHQHLRNELVSVYGRLIGIQFRYYDNTDIDTAVRGDEEDEYVGPAPGEHKDVNSPPAELFDIDPDDGKVRYSASDVTENDDDKEWIDEIIAQSFEDMGEQ